MSSDLRKSSRSRPRASRFSPAAEKMRLCAFLLWTYYGYPNSNYEGKNVEVMRYRNGEIMARNAMADGTAPDVDYVAGVPDSGLPHGIGYANESGKKFARPFIKYTPTWSRSFMPANQQIRNQVAKMKQIPVPELIKDKSFFSSTTPSCAVRSFVKRSTSSTSPARRKCTCAPPARRSCTAAKYLNFSAATPTWSSSPVASFRSLKATRVTSTSPSTPTPDRASACSSPSATRWASTHARLQSVEGLIGSSALTPRSSARTADREGIIR